MRDLYVVDNEFEETGNKLASHRNFLSEVIEDYVYILEYITSSDKLEGSFANSLRAFSDSVKPYSKKLVETGAEYESDCDSFIKDIDVADQFLY